MPSSHEQVEPYVSPGMPPLNLGKTLSFFEFWPSWAMYLPVVLQWFALSIKHRSLTLPLIANPEIPLSGMVGVPKSLLLEQATGQLKDCILPFFIWQVSGDRDELDQLTKKISDIGFHFPLVCKPDIGCRGVGVKLIKNTSELSACLATYLPGSRVMVQVLSDYEPEAGIFYIKRPEQPRGEIISMAFKYMPYVIGDGERTLAQLIDADERACKVRHLYEKRHQAVWQTVLPKDEPFRLIFSASHSKGAIFKDAWEHVTPTLSQKIHNLMTDLPEFYFGRLDVKFKDVASLKQGKHLQIVEINTASSESLHIWDSNTAFTQAVKALMRQYHVLFTLGAHHRARGYKPPGFRRLVRHWRLENRLSKHYPETD